MTLASVAQIVPFIYTAGLPSSSILFSPSPSPFNSSSHRRPSRSSSSSSSSALHLLDILFPNLWLAIPLLLPECFASYHGFYKPLTNVAPLFSRCCHRLSFACCRAFALAIGRQQSSYFLLAPNASTGRFTSYYLPFYYHHHCHFPQTCSE